METIIIQAKDKKEADFLKKLLLKLNVTIKKKYSEPSNIDFVSEEEQKELEKELQDPDTTEIVNSETTKL